jgi:leucyl-tRNA synthetase
VRAFVLFLGPAEKEAEWSDDGIAGVERFLVRVRTAVEKFAASGGDPKAQPKAADTPAARSRHMAIQRVTGDFEAFSFHTAVARLMEFSRRVADLVNDPSAEPGETAASVRTLLRLMHPVAPHLTEELHERLGFPKSLLLAGWPAYDAALAVEELATVVVQIAGRVRGQVQVARGTAEGDVVAAAEREPSVAKWLAGKTRVKTVFVPDRLLNLVVR